MILQNFKPVLSARKMVDFPNRIRYLPQVTAQLMVYSALRSIFQQKNRHAEPVHNKIIQILKMSGKNA